MLMWASHMLQLKTLLWCESQRSSNESYFTTAQHKHVSLLESVEPADDVGASLDGHGEDKPIVVVRVLADQVHAAGALRRPPEARGQQQRHACGNRRGIDAKNQQQAQFKAGHIEQLNVRDRTSGEVSCYGCIHLTHNARQEETCKSGETWMAQQKHETKATKGATAKLTVMVRCARAQGNTRTSGTHETKGNVQRLQRVRWHNTEDGTTREQQPSAHSGSQQLWSSDSIAVAYSFARRIATLLGLARLLRPGTVPTISSAAEMLLKQRSCLLQQRHRWAFALPRWARLAL